MGQSRRRIPRGRSLLGSSPCVTSSPVGANDWQAGNWQVYVIDPASRFMSVMLMGEQAVRVGLGLSYVRQTSADRRQRQLDSQS
jgi:hypothetical protein